VAVFLGYQTYETIPSGKYTLKWTGTEHRARAEWQGTAEKLEARLGEIAEKMIELGSLQPLFRREREAAEERARREAERRETARRVAASRAEQLKRAFSMVEIHERIQRLEIFLRYLAEHASDLKEPYADRLKVWLSVVREELAERALHWTSSSRRCSPCPAGEPGHRHGGQSRTSLRIEGPSDFFGHHSRVRIGM